MPKGIPIDARFVGKVNRLSNGCWEWTGQITRTGYPRFSAYGQSVAAHRFAYEYFVGPIPAGLTLDHHCHTEDLTCKGGPTCRHRRCVRPDHLVPMTMEMNVGLQYKARATHCTKGHEFTETNTKIRIEGGRPKRTCRKCSYRRKSAKRSADRAAARAAKPPKPRPTHCRYGHPYAGGNLYVVPSTGVWQCRSCGTAAEERRKERRRAARAAAA